MPTTITFFPVDNGDMTLIKFGDLDATTLLIDVNIRQDADDPDALIGRRIGLIDDAERRFPTRDIEKSRAHILRPRHLALDRIPDAQLFERRLAVFPGWNGIRVGHGESLAIQELGKGKMRLDLDLGCRSLRRDQHERVAEQIPARVGFDRVALGKIVHPVDIGGDEDVGRRPGFDLFRQGRTRRVGKDHVLAGLFRVLRGDIVEGVLHARRREHQRAVARGAGVVRGVSSGAFALPTTIASRVGDPEGKTSPEELLAAAHSACYCMAFSNGLSKAGHRVERLNTTAEVEFVPGTGITTVTLTVVGRVTGIDAAEFQKLAEAAKDGCPVSKALHGNVTLKLNARLEKL